MQNRSKHAYFAKRLTNVLLEKNIQPSPATVANAFNKQSKKVTLKSHTVRKWLLGLSKPRTEVLLLITNWLNVDPHELIADKEEIGISENKVSFEFDFTDQEVISKYLAMTIKEKVIVRLVIDAIASKQK